MNPKLDCFSDSVVALNQDLKLSYIFVAIEVVSRFYLIFQYCQQTKAIMLYKIVNQLLDI